MDDTARLASRDRHDLFLASASRRALHPVIVEKDFWVCWALKQIFALENPPAALVFKGGTSLSKVWNVIERFSEDIDLSFNRSDLGFGGESDPAAAASGKKRSRQIERLTEACRQMIQDVFLPLLIETFTQRLGSPPGAEWSLEQDSDDPQTVLFDYPVLARDQTAQAYLRQTIRLEFGARSEHWPTLAARIRPFASIDFPTAFREPECVVKVVAAERTFWEKATILHAWHHAPRGQSLRDRQSRHYYDVHKLYRSPIGESALADAELLQKVARHKSLFFASAWARYDQAVAGTLKLIPPEFRIVELERDYSQMRDEMIFGDAPTLAEILTSLRQIEERVNGAPE